MRSKRKSPQRLGSVLERCRAMPAFAFPPSAMMPKWKSPCNGLGADKIPEFKKPLFGQIGLAFWRLAFGGALVRGQLRILLVHLQIWESESEGPIPNLAFGGMPSSSCSCSFRNKRRLRGWRRGPRGRFRVARREGFCPRRTLRRPSGRSRRGFRCPQGQSPRSRARR